jgi:hypothetical protein
MLHEWMVLKDEDCSDMEAVKAANPLSMITVETLAEDFAPDLRSGRLEAAEVQPPDAQPQVGDHRQGVGRRADRGAVPGRREHRRRRGHRVQVGHDGAGAVVEGAEVPPARRPRRSSFLPRDGSSLHPDVIKQALLDLGADLPVETVVMDMERAADIAHWIEDEMGVTVIDRGQSNKFAVADYNAFMDGLRNKTVKHTGDPGLRAHVLHAIARQLPGGDYRFDRHSSVRQNVGRRIGA